MIEKGLPSFCITINPADVYNPIVKFLAGSEIDLDPSLPQDISNYWDQSILVAKNPVVAARFFNLPAMSTLYTPQRGMTDVCSM
jgi:hypothetical protein